MRCWLMVTTETHQCAAISPPNSLRVGASRSCRQSCSLCIPLPCPDCLASVHLCVCVCVCATRNVSSHLFLNKQLVHRSSFIVHRSSFIVHRSSFIVRRCQYLPRAPVRSWDILSGENLVATGRIGIVDTRAASPFWPTYSVSSEA